MPLAYWVSPALTFFVTACSVAALFGMMRTTVKSLNKEVDRIRECLDRQSEIFTSFREEVRLTFAFQNMKTTARKPKIVK